VTRTLIIGDVHGCLNELDELLDRAKITSSDRTLFVGDVIGRGPNSVGVLDRIVSLGALCVQGNHERKLLQLVDGKKDIGELARLAASHRSFAQYLEPQHWFMLRAMPLFLDLPEHGACVVHAGMLHGLDLAAQDPWVLTHMRSVDSFGHPSSELGHESWAATYPGPTHVVFGHSAQRGLQLHSHATGLDSGCVYGGRLTGLLLEAGQPVPALLDRSRAILSVAARSVYCRPKP
jgi:hypothetical protein